MILNALAASLFITLFFPLIQSMKAFYEVWSSEEYYHWQELGEPTFFIFYRSLYFRLIWGKEVDHMENKKLLKKRSDIRFISCMLIISGMMINATV